MNKELMLKTAFLLPVSSDEYHGDGQIHPLKLWLELENDLAARFGGFTCSENVRGVYVNGDGIKVTDQSRKYEVAISREDLEPMCSFLHDVAKKFGQECVYFECDGEVGFIYAEDPEEDKEFEPTEEEWKEIKRAILEEEEEEQREAEEEDERELSALKTWMKKNGMSWDKEYIKEDHNG